MSQTNGHKSNGNGKQKQPLKKAVDPKAAAITTLKTRFLEVLKVNGGNVSGALRTAGLKRNAAYDHFKTDTDFADQWLDALEIGTDELFTEARRRATKGTLKPVFHNGVRCGSVREFSDTLLIFLLKQGEAQKKWRNRIVQTGNLALECVRTAGSEVGLNEEQIVAIQTDMATKFEKVSLI